MKKIILIMLLLVVSVFAQQNMSGNITQPVNGSFTLSGSLGCILQDRQLLFGPVSSIMDEDECLRSDFFEANGILSCIAGVCELTTTLYTEATAAFVATEKEDALMADAFSILDESTECLVAVYNGSIVNATPQMDINVGANLYFNTIKPCYVRTIAALGMLEQIFADEEDASFLVQKFQELEVDYQHLLTREDLKASSAFNVSKATLTGTVEGAAGGQQPLGGAFEITVQHNQGDPSTIDITVTQTNAPGSVFTDAATINWAFYSDTSTICTLGLNPTFAFPAGVSATPFQNQRISLLGSVCAGSFVVTAGATTPAVITVQFSQASNGFAYDILTADTDANPADQDDDRVVGDTISGTQVSVNYENYPTADSEIDTGLFDSFGFPPISVLPGPPPLVTFLLGVGNLGQTGAIGGGMITHAEGDVPAMASSSFEITTTTVPGFTNIAFGLAGGFLSAFQWEGSVSDGDTITALFAGPTTDGEIIINGEQKGVVSEDTRVSNNMVIFNAGQGVGTILSTPTGAVTLNAEGDKSGILLLGIFAFLTLAIFLFILKKKQQ